MLAAFAGATAYLFLFPAEDPLPRRADAIVVLSGGRGDRVAAGLRLWESGLAATLVLSDGRADDAEEGTRRCGRERVLCFVPDPYSTQGEARWIGREAARRGWDEVVVVTSTYHLRRARMVVERCYEGGLAVVGSDPPLANRLVGVAWEWPKSVWYLTRKRGC